METTSDQHVGPVKGLTVITCNLRGLRSKLDEIQEIAGSVRPDVMCFTETWLTADINDCEISIPGFQCIRTDRQSGRGGGVILYHTTNLNAHLLDTFYNFDGSTEAMCCRVSGALKNATIGVVYRAPGSTGMELLAKLEQWRSRNDLLLLGDFNAPGIDWVDLNSSSSTSTFDTALLDWALDGNLTQHLLEPTRRLPTQQHNTLDLVFTSLPMDLENLMYLSPIANSDHVTIQFDWLRCAPNYIGNTVKHSIWKADFDLLRREANRLDWDLAGCTDVNEAWTKIRNNLSSLVSSHVPTVRRRKLCSGPPWIDNELRQLFKRRQRLWNNFRRSSSSLDYGRYKACRNLCTLKKREKRKLYELQLLDEATTNSKRLFGYVKRRSKSGIGIPPLLLSGSLVEDDCSKAEALAAQYGSVFAQESTLLPSFPQCHLSDSIDNVVIDVDGVVKSLRMLKPQSSPGPDGIHPLLLRNLACELAPPLTQLFRLSLNQGRIPDEWKTATVQPIFKGGSKNVPENYRPISLTSVVCKVLERLIKSQLQDFLRSCNAISPAQHGFQKNRSCTTNLLIARERWAHELDQGNHLEVVYIDFSKAFDKVPHQRLLLKLLSYGVKGKLLDWIASFLSDRRLRVRVNAAYSDFLPATSGVPQGSVLGPELFKIYVNDLPACIASECILYADDLKIWTPVASLHQALELQQSLDKLVEWSTLWELPINSRKCAVLPVGTSTPLHPYSLGGVPLNIVEQIKDLGIIVSADFKSILETNRKVAVSSRVLAMLRRAFSCWTPDIFRKLFTSFVRPLLEYGQPAFFPMTKGECDRLESVQRRGTRWIPALRGLTYPERLEHLDLFSLDYRRRRGDLIFTRRILLGQLGPEISSFFALNTAGPTRGHSLKLFKPRRQILRTNATLSTRVVNDWNRLPPAAVDISSEASFKKFLDQYAVNNQEWSSSYVQQSTSS